MQGTSASFVSPARLPPYCELCPDLSLGNYPSSLWAVKYYIFIGYIFTQIACTNNLLVVLLELFVGQVVAFCLLFNAFLLPHKSMKLRPLGQCFFQIHSPRGLFSSLPASPAPPPPPPFWELTVSTVFGFPGSLWLLLWVRRVKSKES